MNKNTHTTTRETNTRETDRQLQRILKDRSYTSPENKWFTAKVMNRLPEQMHPTPIKAYISYALALIMLVAGWIYAVDLTIEHGFNATTISMAALLPLTSLLCIGIFVTPILKKSL